MNKQHTQDQLKQVRNTSNINTVMTNRVITTTNIESISYWDILNANLIYWPLKQGGAYIHKNRWGRNGFASNEELIRLLDIAKQWSKHFDLSTNNL